MEILKISGELNEAQWAEIINKVQDKHLPKILKEKRLEYVEYFIYNTVQKGDSFIAHYKMNGRDKYLACFGKTGCATCGNGGYISDWRMFDSLEQLSGFISEANLKESDIISEKELNKLFDMTPKIIEIDQPKEKALLIFSGALLVILLKDYTLLECNLDFSFDYFFSLHKDKLAHFCSVLKPFEKNQMVAELTKKAKNILAAQSN